MPRPRFAQAARDVALSRLIDLLRRGGRPTPHQDRAQQGRRAGWYDGGQDQSCSAGCAATRTRCTPTSLGTSPSPGAPPALITRWHGACAPCRRDHAGTATHHRRPPTVRPPGSVSTGLLIASVGGVSRSSCSGQYAGAAEVPCWNHNGACYHTSASRARGSLDCDATPPAGHQKHRLCFCSALRLEGDDGRGKSEAAKSEAAKSEATKSGAAKSEAAKSEVAAAAKTRTASGGAGGSGQPKRRRKHATMTRQAKGVGRGGKGGAPKMMKGGRGRR